MKDSKAQEVDGGKSTTIFEIVVSAIIAIYFFFVLLMFTPDSFLKRNLFAPIYRAWTFCGLYQSWSLFSPSIRQLNYYPSAVITFEDGSKTLWEPPLMDRLSLIERFQREKFRKWSIDSLPWPRFKNFWVDFAQFVGHQYYNPANKPVSVSLNLRWIEIPDPSEKFYMQNALPPCTKFNTSFCYQYSSEDFR